MEPDAPLLFTDNETNNRRLFGTPNASEFVKDGINDYVVHQRREGVNAKAGTKSAADCAVTVAPGRTAVLRLRLSNRAPIGAVDRFADFDATFDARPPVVSVGRGRRAVLLRLLQPRLREIFAWATSVVEG